MNATCSETFTGSWASPTRRIASPIRRRSFSTSANIYAYVLPAMKQEAAERMDAVLRGVASSVAPERPAAGAKPS